MNDKFTVTEIKNIIFVSTSPEQQKKSVFPSCFKSNELIFQFSGKTLVEIGESKFITKENSIRFMQKGEHGKYCVDRLESGEFIDIFFETKEKFDKDLIVINDISNAKIGVIFKKMFNLWIQKEQGYYIKCMALLYELIDFALSDSYVPSTKKEKIMPAVTYIQQHYFEEINCNSLAEMCHISYSYLKMLFIDVYGVSPQKYILSLKINCACDMLKTNMFSVLEVSSQCGFSYDTYFSRMFKKYTGMSPREYKNKYVKNQTL